MFTFHLYVTLAYIMRHTLRVMIFFWGGFCFVQCHHMSLLDFVVLPPGHGSSVTDFWGWDAHETQLRCPDDVSVDIGGCSVRRALKLKFYQPTQTMVTAGILPITENSHGRAGNWTRDLMISSQKLWLLDHEVGHWGWCINIGTCSSAMRIR